MFHKKVAKRISEVIKPEWPPWARNRCRREAQYYINIIRDDEETGNGKTTAKAMENLTELVQRWGRTRWESLPPDNLTQIPGESINDYLDRALLLIGFE